MAPVEVNKRNEAVVLKNLSKNRQHYKSVDRKINFKVGDKVRICQYKHFFAKGYLPNWTNDIFTIQSVQPTIPTTYRVKDYKNNAVEGSFYGYVLKKAKLTDVYLVEKVLR